MKAFRTTHSPHARAARLGPASRVLALSALLMLASGLRPSALLAQRAESIRGRVTNDSARVLPGAVISITRGPDRVVQGGLTDSTGAFRVDFAAGYGDYLVHVAAPGYLGARRRVQLAEGERVATADFVLRLSPVLATVRVTATRPTRASNAVTQGEPSTGSSERWADGAIGQVPPTRAGDLNLLASTIPGVTTTPGGVSVLGAGPMSNLVSMNGLELPVSTMPRSARLEARVAAAPYDATRGGFSGAMIDVRLAPGDRNYQQRSAFLTADPAMLGTGPADRASLTPSTSSYRAGVGADGELVRRTLLYNVALDVTRTVTAGPTVFGASSAALQRVGMEPSEVGRLSQLARGFGLLVGTAGDALLARTGSLALLGRFDHVGDSLRVLTLTTFANASKSDGVGAAATASPTGASGQNALAWGGQFTHSQFVGPRHRFLVQNKVGVSSSSSTQTSARILPSISVRLAGADTANPRSTIVQLGGSAASPSQDQRWTAEGASELFWNARGRAHRLHALAGGRIETLRTELFTNVNGRYAYNSVDAFASRQPASFTRSFGAVVRSGQAWNGALALNDEWSKSRQLTLTYGLRAEASGAMTHGVGDENVARSFGLRTDRVPLQLHVSPRAGFTYVYNTNRDAGLSSVGSPIGRFTRGQFGVVRGGIGAFRDLLRPGVFASYGRAANTQQLTCVGAAVPLPSVDATHDNAELPHECLAVDAPLVQRAPNIQLLDRAFDVPTAWRASLNWMTAIRKLTLRVDAVGSMTRSRSSVVDANFAGTERFVLRDEGSRPVYVPSAAIDRQSGAVSALGSRRAVEYGTVTVRRSDLKATAGQLTVTVAPDLTRLRLPMSLSGAASYSLQSAREQARGFDVATVGDPRTATWGPSPFDARHSVLLQGGVYHRRVGTVTAFFRTQSGLPFTPLVGGDINGDGLLNDQAWIPRGPNPTADRLSAQIAALAAEVPDGVRHCLVGNRGTRTDRNDCRGSWTQTMNLQWVPPLRMRLRDHAVSSAVYFQNPLGGLDQLLHGAQGLRGWGAQHAPDPVLLLPRSFDADRQAFAYDVNPRFGGAHATRALARTPFRVSVDFSIDLAVPYNVQSLRRALEPVRTAGAWQRRSADSIASFYARRRAGNLFRMVLSESDSLLLTQAQIGRLRAGDSMYVRQIRTLYRPLGAMLAPLADGTANAEALAQVSAAEAAHQQFFWASVEEVSRILGNGQLEMMPLIKQMLAVPTDRRPTSFFGFGFLVDYTDRPRR